MFDEETSPRRRWPRTQRFVLSELGAGAEASYRSQVVASRSEGGRASFDAARSAWAAPLGVHPGDGAYLGVVRGGPISLHEICSALEDSGESRKEAMEALERLFDAGLVVATDGS
jgi:hypothetical protein